MKPLVSVLIPVHNAENWLHSTLCCACSQTYSNVEIIVVDDGSTDGSYEVAKNFECRNVKVIRQEHRGACVARNRALAEAQGQYVQFLDADDLMEADKLEVQVRRLKESHSGAVAATRWTRFYADIGDGPHPPVPEEWQHDDPFEWLVEAQAGRAMMPSHGWLTPRSVVDEAGKWDQDLLINQDGEFFSRVLLNAKRIEFCPSTAVYYRSGRPANVSNRNSAEVIRSQYEASVKIARRLLERDDSPHVRKACADSFQHIAFRAYPEAPGISVSAQERVRELGGSDLEPDGGRVFQALVRGFGWKAALRVRKLFHDLLPGGPAA